jgi:hypothetical protein
MFPFDKKSNFIAQLEFKDVNGSTANNEFMNESKKNAMWNFFLK